MASIFQPINTFIKNINSSVAKLAGNKSSYLIYNGEHRLLRRPGDSQPLDFQFKFAESFWLNHLFDEEYSS